MRLTLVTHAYPRRPGDPAGAFVARLAEALVARGHAVRVVLPTDGGRSFAPDLNGVALDWVRYDAPARETLAYRGTMAMALRSPRGLLSFVRLVRALTAAVRGHASVSDVVHAHWWVPAGVVARRAGAPYVVTMHGTDVAMLDRVPLASRLGRGVFQRAAAVTAVSTYLAERAKALTGFAGPIAVQPMPIHPADAPSMGPRVHASTGPRIVFVGRLTGQKRVHLAIDALRDLPADVTLEVVGDGPERSNLERRAARVAPDRVRFVGAVPPGEVGRALEGAAAFVFPAEREGYGLAVAEAVLAGIPAVVAEDGGGVLDIVTPEAGIVAPPTAEAFAAALRSLVDDPTARTRAAVAGEVLGRQLSPDAVAAAFEILYEQVAG